LEWIKKVCDAYGSEAGTAEEAAPGARDLAVEPHWGQQPVGGGR
jgi:hypothetical protein